MVHIKHIKKPIIFILILILILVLLFFKFIIIKSILNSKKANKCITNEYNKVKKFTSQIITNNKLEKLDFNVKQEESKTLFEIDSSLTNTMIKKEKESTILIDLSYKNNRKSLFNNKDANNNIYITDKDRKDSFHGNLAVQSTANQTDSQQSLELLFSNSNTENLVNGNIYDTVKKETNQMTIINKMFFDQGLLHDKESIVKVFFDFYDDFYLKIMKISVAIHNNTPLNKLNTKSNHKENIYKKIVYEIYKNLQENLFDTTHYNENNVIKFFKDSRNSKLDKIIFLVDRCKILTENLNISEMEFRKNHEENKKLFDQVCSSILNLEINNEINYLAYFDKLIMEQNIERAVIKEWNTKFQKYDFKSNIVNENMIYSNFHKKFIEIYAKYIRLFSKEHNQASNEKVLEIIYESNEIIYDNRIIFSINNLNIEKYKCNISECELVKFINSLIYFYNDNFDNLFPNSNKDNIEIENQRILCLILILETINAFSILKKEVRINFYELNIVEKKIIIYINQFSICLRTTSKKFSNLLYFYKFYYVIVMLKVIYNSNINNENDYIYSKISLFFDEISIQETHEKLLKYLNKKESIFKIFSKKSLTYILIEILSIRHWIFCTDNFYLCILDVIGERCIEVLLLNSIYSQGFVDNLIYFYNVITKMLKKAKKILTKKNFLNFQNIIFFNFELDTSCINIIIYNELHLFCKKIFFFKNTLIKKNIVNDIQQKKIVYDEFFKKEVNPLIKTNKTLLNNKIILNQIYQIMNIYIEDLGKLNDSLDHEKCIYMPRLYNFQYLLFFSETYIVVDKEKFLFKQILLKIKILYDLIEKNIKYKTEYLSKFFCEDFEHEKIYFNYKIAIITIQNLDYLIKVYLFMYYQFKSKSVVYIEMHDTEIADIVQNSNELYNRFIILLVEKNNDFKFYLKIMKIFMVLSIDYNFVSVSCQRIYEFFPEKIDLEKIIINQFIVLLENFSSNDENIFIIGKNIYFNYFKILKRMKSSDYIQKKYMEFYNFLYNFIEIFENSIKTKIKNQLINISSRKMFLYEKKRSMVGIIILEQLKIFNQKNLEYLANIRTRIKKLITNKISLEIKTYMNLFKYLILVNECSDFIENIHQDKNFVHFCITDLQNQLKNKDKKNKTNNISLVLNYKKLSEITLQYKNLGTGKDLLIKEIGKHMTNIFIEHLMIMFLLDNRLNFNN